MTDEAIARTTDPQTSHEAAASMTAALPALDRTIFEAIKRTGSHGGTVDELTEATNCQKVSVSPRLKPLEVKGLIRRSGTRLAASGRMQQVWVVEQLPIQRAPEKPRPPRRPQVMPLTAAQLRLF